MVHCRHGEVSLRLILPGWDAVLPWYTYPLLEDQNMLCFPHLQSESATLKQRERWLCLSSLL